MSTIIRLSRTGRNNLARYRMVVADTRMKRDGRFIEVLGTVDPHKVDIAQKMAINPERILHWISAGARPSATVAQLLLAAGIDTAKKRKPYRRKAQRIKKAPAKKTAKK